MKDYKYVIVGAGLSGLTIAERIANELDEEVLIIEKRNHIAGNCYDFYKEGILIQKYGPHIFHTKEKRFMTTSPNSLNGPIMCTGS